MKPKLCIVVPVLDEGGQLAQALAALQPFRERGARLVVVDGGSADDTLAVARAHADLAFVAPRGRGSQMNAGAAACPADTLLFVHADTRLPANADRLIRDALAGRCRWGYFDVRIASPRRVLHVVAWCMNLRSRLTGIATGDQCLFMRRESFDAAGGFPDIALMEDIAMSRTLKRLGAPIAVRARVETSARRWDRDGVWQTIFLMWRLRAAFFFGADPRRLALRYGYRPR